MWVAGVIALVLIALAIYEYRLRKPDQLVLYETGGTIRLRTGAFYPRHFSLALPGTTHQMEMTIDGIARGSIRIRTTLVVTVAPSRNHLDGLVRTGGWKRNSVVKAAGEFETVIQSLVKEYTERNLIEELSSEHLGGHLAGGARERASKFGLEVVSLAVQSIDAADPAIAEAMRQRESARILEQTELLNQQARVAAARAKIEADERIALCEHELELKRYELKKAELEQEALLAERRTEDELKRSRMRLEFEKEEMGLLKSSPELLLLSPQAARLAEASQTLKNARTVISLGATESETAAGLPGVLRRFLDLVLDSERKQS